MKRVIVDSSVIIGFIRTKKGEYLRLSELARSEKISLCVPSVVFLEIWAGSSMENPEVARNTKKTFSICKVYDLTKQIAETAGDLIRRNEVSATIDAIIAATALYLDAELATLNQKHFAKVKDLKLFKV